MMEPSAELNLGQNVDAIRDLIDAHLAGRSGTWIASFAELMAIADDRGVPIFAMQPTVTRRLAREGDGEQDDAAGREALKDALIGRWAAHIARSCMNAMDPLVAVIEVEVIGEYRLCLTFGDGTVGEVAFDEREWRGVFEPLADPAFFAQVRVDPECGTIAWPNGVDMAPEPLYAEARAHQRNGSSISR